MSELQFAVPTLFGLEGICADEVRRLGLPEVRAKNGRVLCTGTEADLPRLNLNLRTGERVLLLLGTLTRCLKGQRPCPGSGSSLGTASSR